MIMSHALHPKLCFTAKKGSKYSASGERRWLWRFGGQRARQLWLSRMTRQSSDSSQLPIFNLFIIMLSLRLLYVSG